MRSTPPAAVAQIGGPYTESLRAFRELSRDLFAAMNRSGHIDELHGPWPELLGWTEEEMRSRPVTELIHPQDRERSIRSLSALSEPGYTIRGFENRFAHRDGTYRWLRWDARSSDDGLLVYGVARDVSDERTSPAVVAGPDQPFRRAVRGAPHGMALVGRDRRFVEVNDALSRMLGYTVEELRQLTPADITHPDDRERSDSDLDRMGSGEVDWVSHEKRYLAKDGRVVWCQLSSSVIRDEDGEPTQYVAQIIDISDRKQQEEERELLLAELEKHNEDLELFAGAASHDLTSPLMTLVGYLDLALDGELPDAETELIRRAKSIGGRSIDLVRNLLGFSRLGTAELSVTRIDTGELVSEVLEQLGADRQASGATVEVADDLADINGDRNAVGVLLQNLVVNAMKFRADGVRPTVRIAATTDAEGMVGLVVEDDGPGIPTSVRSRVFEPFTRAPSGTQRAGSGLGLATCRRIAERHGGTIRAEDSELGGARLVVTLPAADRRAAWAGTAAVHRAEAAE